MSDDFESRLQRMSTSELERELRRPNVREGYKRAIREELSQRNGGSADGGTMSLFGDQNRTSNIEHRTSNAE